MKKILKDYDFTLIITPILLAAFGLVMIYSASMVTATVDGLDSKYFLYKQLQWFIIGIIGFIFLSIFPYKKYQKMTQLIIISSIILLVSVLMFGETVNKATRSITLFGTFNVQPAEFVKLGIIIYLASVYSKKQKYIDSFSRGIAPPLILVVLLLGLILKQPDIGTAGIILATTVIMIFSAGFRVKHLLILSASFITLIALLIPVMATDTRLARITGAYQPFTTPESSGYHLIQSYLAIGSSGLSGEGLGQSVQKLGYLWGAHTDFIMAIVAEELGVIGVLSVIGLLALIVLRGFYIARFCDDQFGSLLAIGISSMIGVQAIINLGAISGILPITGVPLPFISYGGSSLFVIMLSMGILNNVAKHVNQQPEKNANIDPQINKNHVLIKGGSNRRWNN